MSLDPASSAADLLKQGMVTWLAMFTEFNKPGMAEIATAAAITAINAKLDADEAAFEKNPTDPATLEQERKELS